MKYTLDYNQYNHDDEYYHEFKIVEKVQSDECFGDILGIDSEKNCLYFNDYAFSELQKRNEEYSLKDFVREHFQNPKAIQGIIRRVLE